jgi:hypothetical protein
MKKNRFLALFLVLTMTLTMTPLAFTAVSANDPVNTTEYSDLGDDPGIGPDEPAALVNLIPNHDFSQGSGASIPSWTNFGGARLETGAGRGGSNAFTVPANQTGANLTPIHLKANTTYYFGAWGKTEGPNTDVTVGVQYRNAPPVGGDNNTWNMVAFNSDSGDYVYRSVNFTTPETIYNTPEIITWKMNTAGIKLYVDSLFLYPAVVIDRLPEKLDYETGESLELGGMIISVLNASADAYESVKVTDDSVQISGFDSAVTGKQTVSLTYNGFKTYIEVTVGEVVPEPVYCGFCGELEDECMCEPAKQPNPDPGVPEGVNPVPAYAQNFLPMGWNLNTDYIVSPDGRWTVSNWGPATGGNMMSRANFDLFDIYQNDGGTGYMSLKTTALNRLASSVIPEHLQSERNGAEVFSPDWSYQYDDKLAYGYGYFECRMKVAGSTPADFAANRGVCASFFLQSGRNDPGDLPGASAFEIDFEFLTNGQIGGSRDPWVNSKNYGYVATVVHPGNTVRYIKMDFNPSKDFYTYGILWLPDRIEWYIDGTLVRASAGNYARESVKVAMNNWTGDSNWGGFTPLDSDAVTYYDFFKYYELLKDEPEKPGFKVEGSKIIDKNGDEFLMKGVNVNGPGWCFPRGTKQDISLIADTWKFNSVRLCTATKWDSWAKNYNNNETDNFDTIIEAFTKRGIVVIIENHDYTGIWPPLADDGGYTTGSGDIIRPLGDLKSYWINLAEKYKDNPYVWFNIMNEPGSGNSQEDAKLWYLVHDEVIAAIRAVGAENIIVLDDHGWGQANGYLDRGAGYDSAVIKMGPALNEKYQNLVYSLHVYDAWRDGKARFDAYFADAKALGLCVILGEYGVGTNSLGQHNAVMNMLNSAIENEIGRLYWAWDDNGLPMTTTGRGWNVNITDGTTMPTNLTWVGEMVWLDNRGELASPVPRYNLNLPLLTNGNFNTNMNGWSNWGGCSVPSSAADSYNGTRFLQIAAGGSGGCGRDVELKPGTTYRLSAAGYGAADLGIKYNYANENMRDGAEFEYHNFINFNSPDEWESKFITFTTQEDMYVTMGTIFIWKNDSPVFRIDDIELYEVIVSDVSIKSPPDKLTYEIGEKFDYSGLALVVEYTDRDPDELTVRGIRPNDQNNDGLVEIGGFDSSVAGRRTIAVKFNNRVVSFDIFIEGKEEKTLVCAVPAAYVTKLAGGKNDLTITVSELYSDGSENETTNTFSIDNNAADFYTVGEYTVYVNTKGNTQIRGIYIVK